MSKVWFITGSSRGLGRSLAEAVLAQGDRLIATARQPEQLSDLVARYGEQVRAVALDVTNSAQARAAVASAVDTFGRLDVVVNNAGYANMASIEDSTEQDLREQIETNLWGVIHVTRAALPILHKQRSGHIIKSLRLVDVVARRDWLAIRPRSGELKASLRYSGGKLNHWGLK